MNENQPHVVLITETLCKSSNEEKNLFPVLDQYTSFSDNTGRGVSAYVHTSLNAQRRHDLETFSPSIVLEFTSKIDSAFAAVIYRSPNADPDENDAVNDMISNLVKCVKDKSCIITGDFNYPTINWDSELCANLPTHPAYKFLDTVQDCFLIQAVKEPTHFRGLQQANILDLVLSSGVEDDIDVTFLPPLGKSHHTVMTFSIPFDQVESTSNVKKERFLMHKGNYKAMRDSFSKKNWETLLSDLSANEAWNVIQNELEVEMKKFIPCRVGVQLKNGKKCKFVPETVLEKIKLKRKAFKMYKKYRTQANFKAYAKARNQVKWALRKSVKQKEITLAKNIKTDPKAFYAYVASKQKPKDGVANLSKNDGSLTENDMEKAEVLNAFFSSVFTKEDLDNIPTFPTRCSNVLSHVTVSEEVMAKKLAGLNISKSCGPDGVHPRLLKELSNELACPLKMLFDRTMQEGKIPEAWKIAEVKPLFKKGEKMKPGNYRPVSLTSIVCKIFEGLIRDDLNAHFTDNKLLSVHQYGFTSGRSCCTQLLTTLKDWLKRLDKGEPVDAIYLDLQKAFDKVPHARLLVKLKGYGINGNLLSWIGDFLSDRSQFVTVGGVSSGKVPVTSGVPQGSVLGPTLFLYFINDMPDVLDCLVKIFADDTKAYGPVSTPEECKNLQKNIDKLLSWTDKWQLKFNNDKCKVLHMGKNNLCYTYKMEGKVLASTDVEKDLGVYVDNELSFEHHITETVKKANRVVGMLSRYIEYKDKDVMIPLFKALVRSILEYGNVTWCPHLKKFRKPIEDVQRRFTKRIQEYGSLDYETRLFKLKLPSLEFRRMRGDMIETYKILHGFYDTTTTNSLLELNTESNTRGHPFKLAKKSFNTTVFQHFFTNRVINLWNSLPEDVVTSGTVNIFKNSLDKYWAQFMYKTDIEI